MGGSTSSPCALERLWGKLKLCIVDMGPKMVKICQNFASIINRWYLRRFFKGGIRISKIVHPFFGTSQIFSTAYIWCRWDVKFEICKCRDTFTILFKVVFFLECFKYIITICTEIPFHEFLHKIIKQRNVRINRFLRILAPWGVSKNYVDKMR